MAKREGHKVALEIVVATNSPVFSDNEEFLIFRPSKPLYRAFIPL